MAVFRWGSALEAFRDLEREMDRWLRRIDQSSYGPRLGRPFPALNMYESETEYLLVAELPGVQAEDLEISLANGALTLKFTRAPQPHVAEEKYRRSERLHGTWERSIALPDRVRDDGIQAEMANGLLKLHLPKVPTAQPRKISILEQPGAATAAQVAPPHEVASDNGGDS
ncbi:MAG: Hsp20/alpha crystallin family protein [Planctomycetaceae bacterium]|nr:Hsp20/alpha crystallin family protein [Planctomycetaceae bacterium]